MRTARRGLAVTELLIAAVVLGMVFIVFLKVFDSSYAQSQQSRNRMVAAILAQSLLDEIEAHPYGAKPTANWGADVVETPVDVWIEARKVDMLFRKTFTFLNGSFVGNTTGDSDVVNVTITWEEAAGHDGPKSLSAVVPVWR